ncbi:MAG TPA: polysaccharide deacetylase family protein [Hanamia sp.]|nr:polysaccharide deacetylase family protein [Hanamia sp.]
MLLIFLKTFTTRCEYVFELLFKHEFGIEYLVTTDIAEFKIQTGEKINYSNSKIANELCIIPSSLLFEDDIKKQKIKVDYKNQAIVLFPNDKCDLGFDIFSAVFYMVSRYEEYLSFSPDKFGRFKAEDSLAFQNNFLQKPVVNTWINIFKNFLLKKIPSLKIKSSEFNAIFTYDIDVAYKYRGRSIGRTIGSALKDIVSFKIKEIISRKKTLLKIQKDPWDVYDYLEETILQNRLNSIFFFLLADKTEHDRNLSYNGSLMKLLISKIGVYSEIGIHPSFTSSSSPEKILIEKERLENLSGKKIIKSRQHYLKFNLPETYNSLIASGITEDHSMGFPEMPGFRAGTCKPFYFYDLKNEKITTLKIFPITCMDATFVYYTKKSPEKSLMEILNLLKEIKKVDGTFISIFHNDHLGKNDDDKKWGKVHDKIIMQVKAYLKK